MSTEKPKPLTEDDRSMTIEKWKDPKTKAWYRAHGYTLGGLIPRDTSRSNDTEGIRKAAQAVRHQD